MPRSQTRPSTPKLSEIARRAVAPKGAVATGWPAVEAKALDLGIRFRPWQPPVGRLILAKRANGKYAATVGGTGLSIPRQVGKTFLVAVIVFALCLLHPKLTVVWTAHRLRTAEETFAKMQAFAKRKRIAPHIFKVTVGSGEGSIRFHNGSRILFGARERGFGRGFDEVDVLIFDEAQILTENALDDMVPATNQSRQPTSALLLFMGTPPKPKDPGEVFTRMRTEAWTGEDDDTGWVEFSADPKHRPAPLPEPLSKADWEQIARANPSYPVDTPREAILRMRKKLGPESFRREGLGIWDEVSGSGIFGVGAWASCSTVMPAGVRLAGLGLACSFDMSRSAVVGAGVDADGRLHGKPLQHGPGMGWVVDRVKALQDEHGVDVAVDGKGPAAVLIPHLERASVKVRTLTLANVQDACADFANRVASGAFGHDDYPELNAAVDVAVKRMVGDRWVLGRKASSSDISTLEAQVFAAYVVDQPAVSLPPPDIF